MHPITRSPVAPAVDGHAGFPPELLRARLDDLAARVAADLERGALEAAWARTRGLEREADPAAVVPAVPVPPAPVIGRRFAAAHRRLLRAAAAVGRREVANDRRHPAA